MTAPTAMPALAPPLRPDARGAFCGDVFSWVTFVVLELALGVAVTRGAEAPVVDAVLDEAVELALELALVVDRVLRSSGAGAWNVSSVGLPHPAAEQQAQRLVAGANTMSDVARKGFESGAS